MFQDSDGSIYAQIFDDEVLAKFAADQGMEHVAPPSAETQSAEPELLPKSLPNNVDHRTVLNDASFDSNSSYKRIGWETAYGTGTRIGNRLVLTAAHVAVGMSDPGGNRFIPRARAATPYSGGDVALVEPYGSSYFAGVGWASAWGSLNCAALGDDSPIECSYYDWAVQILYQNPAFSPDPGYLGFEWGTDAWIGSKNRSHVGYPWCGATDPKDHDWPVSCTTYENTSQLIVPWGDVIGNCAGVAPVFQGGSTMNYWPFSDGTNPLMVTGCSVSAGHSGGPVYEPAGPWVMSVVTRELCSYPPTGRGTGCAGVYDVTATTRFNQTLYDYMVSLRSSYPLLVPPFTGTMNLFRLRPGVVCCCFTFFWLCAGARVALGAEPSSSNVVRVVTTPRLGSERYCLGALITPYWVLSAAHCAPPPSTGFVLVPCAQYSVAVVEIVVHPELDLALMQLAGNVPCNDERVAAGIDAELYTFTGGRVALPNLMATNAAFDSAGAGWLRVRSSHGPCAGDSGGPLLSSNGTLMGILSRGDPSCSGLDEFVLVDQARSWILSETSKSELLRSNID